MRTVVGVSIVSEDLSYLQALRAVLDTSPGLRCLGAYTVFEEAIALSTHPDVAVVDLGAHQNPGCELVHQLKARRPKSAVLIIAPFLDRQRILDCLSAGAHGYLLKSSSWAAVCEAILELHQGGSPMSPPVARKVIDFLHSAPTPPRNEPLSGREEEILHLATVGARNKEIAAKLKISTATVCAHLRTIYRKLGVRSRSEAARSLALLKRKAS